MCPSEYFTFVCAEVVQLRKNGVLNAQLIRLYNKMTCHSTYVIVQQCPECVMQIWEYVCNNTLWPAVCAYGKVGVTHLHSGSIHFLSSVSQKYGWYKEKWPDVCFPLCVVLNFHGIFIKYESHCWTIIVTGMYNHFIIILLPVLFLSHIHQIHCPCCCFCLFHYLLSLFFSSFVSYIFIHYCFLGCQHIHKHWSTCLFQLAWISRMINN
jgi:hypothetical protein